GVRMEDQRPQDSTTEDRCTAVVRDGDAPPNPLFTPPCACPRCAPEVAYDRSTGDGWLRLSGHRQRYRVELVELGVAGKAVLG
ncbi:MAG: hypothetical protein ACR2QK_05765, partial [Acidimicrobiales bacterium]